MNIHEKRSADVLFFNCQSYFGKIAVALIHNHNALGVLQVGTCLVNSSLNVFFPMAAWPISPRLA